MRRIIPKTILLLLVSTACVAADYTFSWVANTDTTVGYNLYYCGITSIPRYGIINCVGTGATEGASPIFIDGVNTEEYTVTGLPDTGIWHFALTAVDDNDDESYYSQIITFLKTSITDTVSYAHGKGSGVANKGGGGVSNAN